MGISKIGHLAGFHVVIHKLIPQQAPYSNVPMVIISREPVHTCKVYLRHGFEPGEGFENYLDCQSPQAQTKILVLG